MTEERKSLVLEKLASRFGGAILSTHSDFGNDTAVGSVAATVGVLGYYGYLHVAKPEDALLLADFLIAIATHDGISPRSTDGTRPDRAHRSA